MSKVTVVVPKIVKGKVAGVTSTYVPKYEPMSTYTYTPYVPKKTITCTTSTGTYQVTQDLCNQFKVSDAKLLQGIADREEATFVENVERATAAYERCIKDAEQFNEQNKFLIQQYPTLAQEALRQYGKLKLQCETNYPPL